MNSTRVAMGVAAVFLAGVGIYFAPNPPQPNPAPSQISGPGQTLADIATVDRGDSATLNTISEASVILDSSGWDGTDTLYLVLTPQSEHPALPPVGSTSSAWNTLRITNFREKGTTKLKTGNTVEQAVAPGDYMLEVWRRSEVTAGSTTPHALIPLTLVQGSNPAVAIVE